MSCSVQLISGSLSHENPGNQLGHPSAIFTLLLTAVTAVAQIICLNRGLKIYDSTLVVPVFYGVYTAAGFLNALVRLYFKRLIALAADRLLIDLQRLG
jgi:magnesium transporter